MYYAYLWLHCLPHLYIAVAEPRYFSETLMKPTRQNASVKELGVAETLTFSDIIFLSVHLKNGEVCLLHSYLQVIAAYCLSSMSNLMHEFSPKLGWSQP